MRNCFVKMKILCCLVLVIIGGTLATVQPKSVNLALETVLQFDKKNHVADLAVITRVQKFLDNIKDVMSVYDGSKQSRRSNRENLKFTDFILEVVNIIRSYNDSDLKEIITVLDDEARKYNYKGCKFYELLDNQSLRRFMSRKLEDAREIPLERLRNLLDSVATRIQNQHFKRQEKKLLSLVNSLYSGSEKRFTEVLSNLLDYGTRRFSLKPNIREIVSKGLKNVVFDFYSKLNPNARMSLKSTVHNFWNHYGGGKHRPSSFATTKREEKSRSNFIDIVDVTRYNNNDMHKWSARAKRTKHIMITTPSFHMDTSLTKKANSHKIDSLGLSLDLNSLKPVFQSFFKKIAFGTENKMKDTGDIIPKRENKTKTKHKNVKHSRPESFIQAKPMSDSFEAVEGAVHEKPRTMMIPYDEIETTTTKKKRDRKSRNKERLNLDNFLKSKSKIRSEIRDLNEIQKKYDKLRKLQSDLSPEVESDKGSFNEPDGSGFEFLMGGQKIQDMQKTQPKLKKHKRIDSKTTPERENRGKTDHHLGVEVTESKELKPKKRLRRPHKSGQKSKKHHKLYKSQPSLFNLRSAKRRESTNNPLASNEGMSIESSENEHRTHSAISPIKNGETESVAENLNPQSATDSNVVSILHKLEKELENVKSKIKYDTTPRTDTPGVTSERHSIKSITDTVLPADILPFWSRPRTAKTKTSSATTLKVVSQENENARRDEFPKHGSKYLRDTLFKSNNITYDSRFISPLQVLLNQTMERISSYINETISTNKNKYNAKDLDFDISDDESKSNERTESVTATTVTKVSKSKTTQESFDKGHNKRTSKEKPKSGPQSLEEGEIKTLSKENVRKESQSLEEGEKRTPSKEKISIGSQSLKEGEKKTLSKEKLGKGSRSLEGGEKITVSKENIKIRSQPLKEHEKSTMSEEEVKNETQSVKELEKRAMSKEKVGKGSQSLEEGEHRTVPKENVKESSAKNEKTTVSKDKVKNVQSSEEGEKGTGSEDNISEWSSLLRKDTNETKSQDNEGEPDGSKTASTPTIENVSLSSPIINDIMNRTENDDLGKFMGILKGESRSNNSGLIPIAADPLTLNELLGDDDTFNLSRP